MFGTKLTFITLFALNAFALPTAQVEDSAVEARGINVCSSFDPQAYHVKLVNADNQGTVGWLGTRCFDEYCFFLIASSQSSAACVKLVSGVSGQGYIMSLQKTPGVTNYVALAGMPVANNPNNTHEVQFNDKKVDSPPSVESSVFNADLTAKFWNMYGSSAPSTPVYFQYGAGTLTYSQVRMPTGLSPDSVPVVFQKVTPPAA